MGKKVALFLQACSGQDMPCHEQWSTHSSQIKNMQPFIYFRDSVMGLYRQQLKNKSAVFPTMIQA
jgi:hypothetical protein